MLSWSDRLKLRIQRRVAQLLMLPYYYLILSWFKLFKKYRFTQLKQARNRFEEILRREKGPFVICANHLTLIDSAIIIWALVPGWRCFLKPSLFPWNLPEKRNFYTNLSMRTFCYIGKCVPIIRRGPPKETRRVLEKVDYLLSHGESITIFPEGTRSRSGRVDPENFAYGVGRIVQRNPGAKVLCLYLRGKGQKTYTDLPRKGEDFSISMKVVHPESEQQGLRAEKEIATDIVHNLHAMEQEYFSLSPEVGVFS